MSVLGLGSRGNTTILPMTAVLSASTFINGQTTLAAAVSPYFATTPEINYVMRIHVGAVLVATGTTQVATVQLKNAALQTNNTAATLLALEGSPVSGGNTVNITAADANTVKEVKINGAVPSGLLPYFLAYTNGSGAGYTVTLYIELIPVTDGACNLS